LDFLYTKKDEAPGLLIPSEIRLDLFFAFSPGFYERLFLLFISLFPFDNFFFLATSHASKNLGLYIHRHFTYAIVI
jgi:hypothetical protein